MNIKKSTLYYRVYGITNDYIYRLFYNYRYYSPGYIINNFNK